MTGVPRKSSVRIILKNSDDLLRILRIDGDPWFGEVARAWGKSEHLSARSFGKLLTVHPSRHARE
jgi:hypothetical protein